MQFKDNPVIVLAVGVIGESPETAKRKYYYVDVQMFDGDLAGQHRVYANDKSELEGIKKGNYIIDAGSAHGDFAALELRMSNLRPVSNNQPKANTFEK